MAAFQEDFFGTIVNVGWAANDTVVLQYTFLTNTPSITTPHANLVLPNDTLALIPGPTLGGPPAYDLVVVHGSGESRYFIHEGCAIVFLNMNAIKRKLPPNQQTYEFQVVIDSTLGGFPGNEVSVGAAAFSKRKDFALTTTDRILPIAPGRPVKETIQIGNQLAVGQSELTVGADYLGYAASKTVSYTYRFANKGLTAIG